jgi:hypothetical protein
VMEQWSGHVDWTSPAAATRGRDSNAHQPGTTPQRIRHRRG